MLAVYSGFISTHPGIFAVYNIWDTIHSHHQLQHSAAYGPFVQNVAHFLAGDIDILHFEIADPTQLKSALEMPVTQTTAFRVRKGKVAEFLKAIDDAIAEKILGEGYNGLCLAYPYEDPYAPGIEWY